MEARNFVKTIGKATNARQILNSVQNDSSRTPGAARLSTLSDVSLAKWSGIASVQQQQLLHKDAKAPGSSRAWLFFMEFHLIVYNESLEKSLSRPIMYTQISSIDDDSAKKKSDRLCITDTSDTCVTFTFRSAKERDEARSRLEALVKEHAGSKPAANASVPFQPLASVLNSKAFDAATSSANLSNHGHGNDDSLSRGIRSPVFSSTTADVLSGTSAWDALSAVMMPASPRSTAPHSEETEKVASDADATTMDETDAEVRYVDAKGVSVVTLLMAFAVCIFAFTVLIIVNSQASYASELRTRIISLRASSPSSSSSQASAKADAKAFAQESSLRSDRTAPPHQDSLNELFRQQFAVNRRARARSSRQEGRKTMKEEMRGRLGAADADMHDDLLPLIVFKMDRVAPDEHLPPTGPAAATPSVADTLIDASATGSHDGIRAPEADPSQHAQPGSTSCVIPQTIQKLPHLSDDVLELLVSHTLHELMERHVRNALGSEIVQLVRNKQLPLYDPHVLALLASKPGDAIRAHVLSYLLDDKASTASFGSGSNAEDTAGP
ncbi:hypothetical protein FVE85_9332 [Porphyridium purpureum]|uniref:PH domain-containing protein n=1 Tax=Porphyridium purpureum TaxID=35688 RepID=A0A5J4YQ21_PORPP|nr:hypothetical protein FVE85_9332 [Porphyridium purpureum]|eukprot:POR0185..scf222_8